MIFLSTTNKYEEKAAGITSRGLSLGFYTLAETLCYIQIAMSLTQLNMLTCDFLKLVL